MKKANIAAVIAMHDAGHSAREIGRNLEISPNTALAYVARRANYLADPEIKKLVDAARKAEEDDIVLLRSKVRARLHEKLDDDKVSPRDLVVSFGVLFDKSRLLENKSSFNVTHGVLLSIQREAIDKGLGTKPAKDKKRNACRKSARKQPASA